ncbi:hypothetical protein BTM369_13050 [Helicobacter pylori]
MENLIMKSFLDYPKYIEDFLEDISIKSFTPFNQRIIKVLVEMNHKNQVPRLETIKLRIGEKDFESEHFKRILEADSYPDYLNLKSDFKPIYIFKCKKTSLTNSKKPHARAKFLIMNF